MQMWFYAKDGRQIGPASEMDLRRLIQRGELSADTLVWHSGMAQWQPLGTTELASSLAEVIVSADTMSDTMSDMMPDMMQNTMPDMMQNTMPSKTGSSGNYQTRYNCPTPERLELLWKRFYRYMFITIALSITVSFVLVAVLSMIHGASSVNQLRGAMENELSPEMQAMYEAMMAEPCLGLTEEELETMPLEELAERLEYIADCEDREEILKTLRRQRANQSGMKSNGSEFFQMFQSLYEELEKLPPGEKFATTLLIALVLLLVLFNFATFVCFLMLLYGLWKVIPPQRARTSPGMAVFGLLIPFWNLYWIFIAEYKLAIQLNKEACRRRLHQHQISPGMVLGFCICQLLTFFGWGGFMALIALILLMLSFRSMTRLAKIIAQDENETKAEVEERLK